MAIEIPRSRLPRDLIVTDDCERMVRHFEGFRPVAYKDPIGIWTIGYGFTENVKSGDTISMADANERLRAELDEHAQIVRDAIPDVPLSQGQWNALVSYAYNIGRLLETLQAKLKARDYAGAQREIPRACRAEGRPLKGLYRRRLAEVCMWEGLPWEGATAPHLIQLTADSAGNIDFGRTTTLEQVLERARQDTATGEIRSKYPSAPPIIPSPAPVAPPELVLDKPAPSPPDNDGPAAEAPAPVLTAPLPVPAPVVLPDVKPIEAKPVAPPPVIQRAPQPPPAPPSPPVPIGQQTSAVDATRNAQDWSENAKEMWRSRRFWGLLLVVTGRVWMLKTGSNAVLGAVSDPLVTEMFSGFMVMIIGEVVQHWGQRKATRPLK